MPASYSPASIDLGLGGEGDLLRSETDETEEQRKKRLAKLGGDPAGGAGSMGANTMGLAAMNLLGQFRG